MCKQYVSSKVHLTFTLHDININIELFVSHVLTNSNTPNQSFGRYRRYSKPSSPDRESQIKTPNMSSSPSPLHSHTLNSSPPYGYADPRDQSYIQPSPTPNLPQHIIPSSTPPLLQPSFYLQYKQYCTTT